MKIQPEVKRKELDEISIRILSDRSLDEDIVRTAQGETIESDLWQKATDLWNDVRQKAQQASEAVSFADVVPRDFQDQSSTEISSELIDKATDYFLKSEMAETGCSTTKDLNLVGTNSLFFLFFLFFEFVF